MIFWGSCGNAGSNDGGEGAELPVQAEFPEATEALDMLAGNCPPCNARNLCDPSCLQALLTCHSITEEEFQLRTMDPTGANPFASVGDMCDAIRGADCQGQMVRLTRSGQLGNSTLVMDFIPIQKELVSVSYPVSLFLAICEMQPIEVSFHLGLRADQVEKDILIRVVGSEGTLKYYDLSDSSPPPPALEMPD